MKNITIVKAAWKEFALKMVFSFLLRAAALIIPIVFGAIINNITEGTLNQAYLMAFVLLGILVSLRITEILNTWSWHKQYNKMYDEYTKVALNKTHDNSLFSLSRLSVSEYINIMNNSVDSLCTFFCDLPVRLFRGLEFLIILFYFFTIDFYVGIASIIISLISFTIMFVARKPIEKANRHSTFSLDKKTTSIHELILCIKEIKTLNVFKPIYNRAVDTTTTYTNALLKRRVIEDCFRFGNTILIETFKMGLLIYGIYLIANDNMQLGTIIIIYNYYNQLIDNMAEFAVINNRLRDISVQTMRFNKILEFSREQSTHEKLLNENPKGEIAFKNILYGFKDDPTLDGISFTFKPNTINALTGPSGNGKNGIFDLLLRLNRQHQGSIKIDNIDIDKYSNEEYFYLVSSAFKDSPFFNMTIKENLMLVENDFEKIVTMCKKLDIHDDIVNLPLGYETEINSNANIDENVKSLLNIARVLLKGTKIILFDHNFSNFDAKTRNKIMKIMFTLKEERTIILITRDVEILKKADHILLIENAKLIDEGTHEHLMQHSLYKENISK